MCEESDILTEATVLTQAAASEKPKARPFREGMYVDIPFDEYREIQAINGSTLKWADESAAHLKAALDGHMSKGDTAATRFGRAFHARVLEPKIYWSEYTIAGNCGTLLKSGARKDQKCGNEGKFYDQGKWFCSNHCPKNKSMGGYLLDEVPNLLSQDEASRVERAAQNVEKHPVMRLIRQRGGFETTLLFTIRDMGLESCPLDAKIRLDKLIVPVQDANGAEIWPTTVVDLKKVGVGKANDTEVAWAIEKYKYDASAAFYIDGVKRVTGRDARFVWVFVEDDYPYQINVVEADDETLQVGRIRYSDWIGKYAVGKLTGEWPGHVAGTRIKRGGLPESVKARFFGRRYN